jgi:hypothetical protein
MAMVSLWMSGGAQLRHTDVLGDLLTFVPGHNHILPEQSVPTTGDACAACSWDQVTGQAHTAALTVVFNHLAQLSRVSEAEPCILLRCFNHYALRGPPPGIS